MRPSGLWRGVVTRVTADGPYVEVARLTRDREYGPCPVLEGPWTAGNPANTADTTTATASGADPAHTHDTTPTGTALAAGDAVLVGFIEGRPDDVAVLGRLS